MQMYGHIETEDILFSFSTGMQLPCFLYQIS